MRYVDEYEEEKSINTMLITTVIVMGIVIAVVTGIVLYQNRTIISDGAGYRRALEQAGLKQTTVVERKSDLEGLVSGSTLTSDQLDFWNLLDLDSSHSNRYGDKNGVITNQTTGETLTETTTKKEIIANTTVTVDNSLDVEAKAETEEIEHPEQTLVKYADGTQEWLAVNFDLPLNNYAEKNFVINNDRMQYIVNGKNKASFGVTISRKQGDVNYKRLKNANVDFAMIKVGQRGYTSGKIVFDNKYQYNLQQAIQNKIDVGVIFTSQAMDLNEVYEETDELIEAIEDYEINYPVALSFETKAGDFARTDGLSVESRTSLAKAFMDEIKKAGYTPILYGDKEELLTKLDISVLQDYDMWLYQEGDAPDYPYEFSMWQCDSTATVSGIPEKVSTSICFSEYTKH